MAALATETTQYETVDPWLEAVEGFCDGRPWVAIPELFGLLGLEYSRQAIRDAQRIGAILTRLGYAQDKHPTNTDLILGIEGQRQRRTVRTRKWRLPGEAISADSSDEGWIDA